MATCRWRAYKATWFAMEEHALNPVSQRLPLCNQGRQTLGASLSRGRYYSQTCHSHGYAVSVVLYLTTLTQSFALIWDVSLGTSTSPVDMFISAILVTSRAGLPGQLMILSMWQIVGDFWYSQLEDSRNLCADELGFPGPFFGLKTAHKLQDFGETTIRHDGERRHAT